MKIGIGPYYLSNYGVDEGCKKMRSHGYTHLDYQLASTKTEFYTLDGEELEAFAESIARELRERGVNIIQTHGVWETPVCADDATEEGREIKLKKMTRSLYCTKLLGGKYTAIHPLFPFGCDSPDNPEEVYRVNKEFFSRLAKIAEEYGVTVCIENMPFTSFPLSTCESLMKLVRDIDSESFKFCLDTGHANIFPEDIADTVRLIGKDCLKIVHVHDNDGAGDQHLVPGDGTIDWEKFTSALREIGFDGVFNIETGPGKVNVDGADAKKKETVLSERISSLAGMAFGE